VKGAHGRQGSNKNAYIYIYGLDIVGYTKALDRRTRCTNNNKENKTIKTKQTALFMGNFVLI